MTFLIARLGIPSQKHKVAVIVFYAILSYSLYWWLRWARFRILSFVVRFNLTNVFFRWLYALKFEHIPQWGVILCSGYLQQ